MTNRVRTMRAQAGGATGRRKLGTGVLLLLSIFAGLIGFAPSAFAHHPALATADVECSTQTEGGWTVTGVSTAWPGAPSQRAHNNIDIYWGPASITWPTNSPTVPAGAILGDEGQYKDDVAAEEPDYSFPFSFEIPATFDPGDVVDVISFANGPWLNGTGGNQWSGLETGGANGTPVALTLPDLDDCTAPELDLVGNPVCAVGGLNVTIANNGDELGTATVTYTQNPGADGVVTYTNIPAGGSQTMLIPILEGSTYTLQFGGPFVPAQPDVSGTRDCAQPNPGASAAVRCAEGDILVTLTNTGADATTADIFKNLVLVGDDVLVPVGGTTFSVDLVPSDENADATIIVDFAVGTDPPPFILPIDCEAPEPGASAAVRCAEGDILVTLSNTGGEGTTADIFKNGVLVGESVGVPPGGTTFSVDLVPADENTNVTITVDFGLGDDPAPFVLPVDCQHPTPGASAVVRCAEGDVLVTLTNTGDDATTADISKNGVVVGNDVAVPPGGATFSVDLVPADENADVTITVDFAIGADPAPIVLAVNCTNPSPGAQATVRCAEGDILVTLTNDGDEATTADISKNGVVVGNDVAVPVGGSTFSVDLVPGDENADVTITVDFAVGADPAPIVLPVDCQHPTPGASADVRCAEGDILVTLTNTGDDATTADISKNGALVANDVAVPVGGATFSVDLVEADENADVTITVDFAVGADPAPIVLAVDCQHPAPGASAELECAEGDILVTLTNSGDDATTADISKNGVLVGDDVPVPVGGSTFPVDLAPGDENTDVTITVDFADGSDPGPLVLPVDCEHPAISSVALECAEGGVVVVLTNDGALPTVVLVDGVAVEVPAGAGTSEENPAIRVVVPVDEDAAYDFTVVGDELEQVFSGTLDCLSPEPSVDDEVVCAAGGLSIVLRNTGDDSATYVITSSALPDGATEATVEAGEVGKVLIPLAEGASADVLVTSDGAVLFDATITRDCETVGGEVIKPPAGLPRTGSNSLSLLTLAGALLLAGTTLVAGGRRRATRALI